MFVWGSNQWGQLGISTPDSELVLQHLLKEHIPVPIPVDLKEAVPGLPQSLLQGIEVG